MALATPKSKRPAPKQVKTPRRVKRPQFSGSQYPRMDMEVLARYASLALARPVSKDDPEVLEYQEALDRHTFVRGGRTSPGYYLNVRMYGVDGTSLTAKLKSGNELMRMNFKQWYRYCCPGKPDAFSKAKSSLGQH